MPALVLQIMPMYKSDSRGMVGASPSCARNGIFQRGPVVDGHLVEQIGDRGKDLPRITGIPIQAG